MVDMSFLVIIIFLLIIAIPVVAGLIISLVAIKKENENSKENKN
jgi:flagellar basal body-associated protein FliL